MILKCVYSVRGRSAEEIKKKLIAISKDEDIMSFNIDPFCTSQ